MTDRVTYGRKRPIHVYQTDTGAWRVDHGLTVYLCATEEQAHRKAREWFTRDVEMELTRG